MQRFVTPSVVWPKVFIIVLLIWTTTGTLPKVPKFCQRQEDDENNCEMKFNPEKVTCKKNLNYLKDYLKTKVVYSCSWTEEFINPEEILANFPFVHKLTIRNGNVTGFLTDFPESKYLKQVILVELNITKLRPELFVFLENLKLLDLSRNRLKNLPPEIIKSHPSLLKVILIENPWNCSSDLKWVLHKSISNKIANRNYMQCGGNTFSGKPVHSVMSLIRKMEKDCPTDICSCTMNNIVWDTNQRFLIPVITVNCSNRDLTDFPEKLPQNTTSLVLSRNLIDTLVPLIHTKIYSDLPDVYLDYNEIKSIDVLEGAQWLKTFRVLSLRGNQLTQLPIYALDNAFEKNRYMAKIYLGNNPWKCDCLFVPEFQHLLIKYATIIKDKNDIRCAVEEGDENSNQLIISLSTKSVCRHDHGVNPLDILSAIFASLIVLIVGKLAYDYWSFKKTGKLPWIVTKMP